MIAHVGGVPIEELLLWALPGGTALLTARVCLTLALARSSLSRRTASAAAVRRLPSPDPRSTR